MRKKQEVVQHGSLCMHHRANRLGGKVTLQVAEICVDGLEPPERVGMTERSGRPEKRSDWGKGHTLLDAIRATCSGGVQLGI